MLSTFRSFLLLALLTAAVLSHADWFAFAPKPDGAEGNGEIDLRFLNEREAGENGHIIAKDGAFHHSANGKPVRFWAVNGIGSESDDPAELRRAARTLAARGVNMARLHGAVFDKEGEVDAKRLRHIAATVEALKAEGIYSHISFYFPLWFTPKAGHPWMEGYDGAKHPFASLYFNEKFQEHYREWMKALLAAPLPKSGRALGEDPAVFGIELVNEDSFFFWTFTDQNIPDAQLRILEKQFGDWLKARHGSLEAAIARWGGLKIPRDAASEGRVGFRPLWQIFSEKKVRDQDAARFLFDTQAGFYSRMREHARSLGFQGLVTASNWSTASPEVFGPLEKLSYATTDFIDRHGYFGCANQGENAEWSLRDNQTFIQRSALRFDPEQPGKGRIYVHPGMDPHYDEKPSMISETTWTRPNRYRSEAPLYYAAYGALQGSDAIVHFAFDGAAWAVKPNYWMQPWTLMTPAMLGQFPAAALIFRQGLVSATAPQVTVTLATNDLFALKGTPMPQDAALDELRLKDVPPGEARTVGGVIDPLIHFTGATKVKFSGSAEAPKFEAGTAGIDRKARTVRSAGGELFLNYGEGFLQINSPRAQGLSGNLKAAGEVRLKDISVSSPLDLGHVVVTPLDGVPIATSGRMLLQAMSEERATGFESQPTPDGREKIIHIGQDPWEIRELAGKVTLHRADASQLRVTALDSNGRKTGSSSAGPEIALAPRTLYYLIEK